MEAFSTAIQRTSGAAQQLDIARQMLLNIETAAQRVAAAQQKINDLTGVAARSDSAQRASDVAAYGEALDALRAKYNPLFAAQQQYRASLQEIGNAERVGALAAAEAAAARQRLKDGFADEVRALNGMAPAQAAATAGYSRLGQAVGQAGFQVQDFFIQVGGGQSALVAFAQQGSQLLGVFGAFGAVAGAALAIGALAAQFAIGKTEAEKFKDGGTGLCRGHPATRPGGE